MLRPTRAQWVFRWDHLVELLLGVLTTYLSLVCMLWIEAPEQRLFWMMTAYCFFSATIGVWFAREWARWAFGLLAAFATVGFGIQIILTLASTTGDQGSPPTYGVAVLFWGVVAHRMLRPSTRRQFRFAREAIARGREPAT